MAGNEMEQYKLIISCSVIEGTSTALKYKWHFTNQPIFI